MVSHPLPCRRAAPRGSPQSRARRRALPASPPASWLDRPLPTPASPPSPHSRRPWRSETLVRVLSRRGQVGRGWGRPRCPALPPPPPNPPRSRAVVHSFRRPAAGPESAPAAAARKSASSFAPRPTPPPPTPPSMPRLRVPASPPHSVSQLCPIAGMEGGGRGGRWGDRCPIAGVAELRGLPPGTELEVPPRPSRRASVLGGVCARAGRPARGTPPPGSPASEGFLGIGRPVRARRKQWPRGPRRAQLGGVGAGKGDGESDRGWNGVAHGPGRVGQAVMACAAAGGDGEPRLAAPHALCRLVRGMGGEGWGYGRRGEGRGRPRVRRRERPLSCGRRSFACVEGGTAGTGSGEGLRGASKARAAKCDEGQVQAAALVRAALGRGRGRTLRRKTPRAAPAPRVSSRLRARLRARCGARAHLHAFVRARARRHARPGGLHPTAQRALRARTHNRARVRRWEANGRPDGIGDGAAPDPLPPFSTSAR